uniref:Uncharacterized protein n=1 Tax=Fundulus heteroclitus TaxID=8078 RepID=A0A3Q2SN32_FUNHE
VPDRVRKLKLNSRLAPVYEDPNSGGKLTPLVDVEELPQKALVHISLTRESSYFASTDIFSDVSSPERLSRWLPGPFPLPRFSSVVGLAFREADTAFEKKGWHGTENKEMAMVVEALVAKHPGLKEMCSVTGWNGWKFEMGNYRTKMGRAGCQEVAVNAGKRSKNKIKIKGPDREPSCTNIKRPKHAEANCRPNFPQREDPSSLEQLKEAVVEEARQTERRIGLINELMQSTVVWQPQTILSSHLVKQFLDLWLCVPSEVLDHAMTQSTTTQRKSVVFGDVLMSLVMFGLIYAPHLHYPTEPTNTFNFNQKVLPGLEGAKLSPRLQTFQDDVMIHV